jgi:hypothetical protein
MCYRVPIFRMIYVMKTGSHKKTQIPTNIMKNINSGHIFYGMSKC